MKTKRTLQIFLVTVFFVLAYSSCRKDSSTTLTPTTDAYSKLLIQIQAVNKSFQLPVQAGALQNAVLPPGAMVTWDTASLWVSTVKFEAEMKKKLITDSTAMADAKHPGFSEDSIKVTFSWRGPEKVNLFKLDTVFGGFTLGPGLYDQVVLSVSGLKSDAGKEPVFYLTGTYTTADTTSRRIIVVVTDNVFFKTKKDSVEVTGSGVDLVSVIQIALDKLMAGIPVSSLDHAKLLPNGTILISISSNSDLYDIILQNLMQQKPCYHHNKGETGDHNTVKPGEDDHNTVQNGGGGQDNGNKGGGQDNGNKGGGKDKGNNGNHGNGNKGNHGEGGHDD